MPDLVLLVGMHRSGTSALTRVLSLCGGALPARLLPPDAGNPSGYWEPLDAIAIDDAYLRARGSSWYDTRFDPRPQPADPALVERIAEFLSTGFTAPGPLLVKEPRLTLLLPAWLAAADALEMPVRVIHVVRDPFEVAASLAVRNRMGTEHGLALWLKYTLAGERDARGRRRLFVAYDDLFADWSAVVARCIGELGLPLAIGAGTPAAVADHLRPALRHHRGAPDREPAGLDPRLVAWARRAGAALRNAVTEPQRARRRLDALRAEFAASSYAAGRAWPEPLAESAGYEPAAPLGVAEAALDPHTAELNRLKYQLEKERYEREIAERETACELAKLREELASATASADRTATIQSQFEAHLAELRTRLATAQAAESDLHAVAAALRGKANAASEQLYEALRRNHALMAELEASRAAGARRNGEPPAAAAAPSPTPELRELRKNTVQLERTVAQLREQLAAREAQLASLQSSRSWRLTAPLRRAKRVLAP
ncbi:MAG TPA: hypothetical protein VHS78_08015 [Candidatus Elarobacter sp.]|jgi:hypothetical protein|nr:hypothetical protein [Candidatus Elarobacter sp.]